MPAPSACSSAAKIVFRSCDIVFAGIHLVFSFVNGREEFLACGHISWQFLCVNSNFSTH